MREADAYSCAGIDETDEKLEMKAYSCCALRSLSMSECSREKMREKLLKRSFSEAVIGVVIAKLEEQRFLDDEEYARSIVKHDVLVNCRSKKLTELKLRSLRVDDWIIQDALASVDNGEVFRVHTEFVDNAIGCILQALEVRHLSVESVKWSCIRSTAGCSAKQPERAFPTSW
ncbi:MAG: RecX family transcriptional regulator [Candidatus Ancillula trichonymphae]|nr:RecX family transcriptional regulator [Candidatus Ancillula trichonymphae]